MLGFRRVAVRGGDGLGIGVPGNGWSSRMRGAYPDDQRDETVSVAKLAVVG